MGVKKHPRKGVLSVFSSFVPRKKCAKRVGRFGGGAGQPAVAADRKRRRYYRRDEVVVVFVVPHGDSFLKNGYKIAPPLLGVLI